MHIRIPLFVEAVQRTAIVTPNTVIGPFTNEEKAAQWAKENQLPPSHTVIKPFNEPAPLAPPIPVKK